MVRMLALAGAAILAACSPSQPAPAQATDGATTSATESIVHPLSGLQVIDVAIETDTRRIVFKSELADTFEAQRQGLMFRTELGEDEGMLFPSDTPETRSFWMKNTPLPLDIIFVGTDGRITNIETAEPYSLDSVPSKGLATAVFEIRGGLAAKLGIDAGDMVTYELPD